MIRAGESVNNAQTTRRSWNPFAALARTAASFTRAPIAGPLVNDDASYDERVNQAQRVYGRDGQRQAQRGKDDKLLWPSLPSIASKGGANERQVPGLDIFSPATPLLEDDDEPEGLDLDESSFLDDEELGNDANTNAKRRRTSQILPAGWDVVAELKSMLTRGFPSNEFVRSNGRHDAAAMQRYRNALRKTHTTTAAAEAQKLLDADHKCKEMWPLIQKAIADDDVALANVTGGIARPVTFAEFDAGVTERFAFLYGGDVESTAPSTDAARESSVQACLSIRAAIHCSRDHARLTSFFVGGSWRDSRASPEELARESRAHRLAANVRDALVGSYASHAMCRTTVGTGAISVLEEGREHFDYQIVHGLQGLAISKELASHESKPSADENNEGMFVLLIGPFSLRQSAPDSQCYRRHASPSTRDRSAPRAHALIVGDNISPSESS